MFSSLLQLLSGHSPQRDMKGRRALVAAINDAEQGLSGRSDGDLYLEANALRVRAGNGETGKKLLIDSFSLVREAARRTLGQRHYDVQLIGGMILDEGRIAEMRTGEGKTLVAALPTFLNALSGKGVHVVTVNEYLARRDAEMIGQVHRFLGLSVGVIGQGMGEMDRRMSYACDVTYGTNSEFGFDYLRDNLKFDMSHMVQRGHHYAIVDEVDSILIDEARTPLIISGPSDDRSGLYVAVDSIVSRLTHAEVAVDEKHRNVILTDQGIESLEILMRNASMLAPDASLYDHGNGTLVHHVNLALRAHHLFRRDKEYIVRNGEVLIVDEHTGRTMIGRRYSEGQHQAIEAKERVAIQPENVTLSSVTYQNYFRMYGKLSGMTGTAMTERDEFEQIYELSVVPVPTNRPVLRKDEDDEIFLTAEDKYAAIVEAVKDAKRRGQPVLVGTPSVEKSEILARLLEREGFRQNSFEPLVDGDEGTDAERVFQVLNARHHEHEAHIIAQAGLPGAITIATNMAGRGTDIQLGGNAEARIEDELAGMPEGEERTAHESRIRQEVARLREQVVAAGGLFVIGAERHESRRIDNQLRGRSGRQGDPGLSRFYVSLEDDVARIFGSERMRSLLPTLGMQQGESLKHPVLSRAMEKAQARIEAMHFDIRKNLIKYDDEVNKQRQAIFGYRTKIMTDTDLTEIIEDMRDEALQGIVSRHIPEDSYPEQWDAVGLASDVGTVLGLNLPIEEWVKEEGVGEDEIVQRVSDAANALVSDIEAAVGPQSMQNAYRIIILTTFDRLWQEHLVAIEGLRAVIGFRGVAQRDPIVEFRTDAFNMFQDMMREVRLQVTSSVLSIRPAVPEEVAA